MVLRDPASEKLQMLGSNTIDKVTFVVRTQKCESGMGMLPRASLGMWDRL